jgi:cytochrome c553
MKLIISVLALCTAIAAIVFTAAENADGAGRRTAPRGSVQAKIEYCKDCHGLSGQGYHGYLTMPRLAGQNPEYLQNQLQDFIAHRRDRDLFINMARVHGTDPQMQAALAAHFQSLNPPPFGGAPRQSIGLGKTIYEDGLPESNVPACSACHGPEAKGQGAIPRLAGQLYPYLVRQLTSWDKVRGQASSSDEAAAVMLPIAHNLSQPQIAAIAAYLSYLR